MDILIIILMLIIPGLAQMLVISNFSKYKHVDNEEEIAGFEVARKILDDNGLKNIYIVEIRGNLTDHYDPKRKVVRLSSDIYHGKSIAAMAVAAHECGHAIQDKEGYLYMRIRSLIFPVVNFMTSISYLIIFIGFLMESLNLIWLGIILVGTGLIFQLITLPVEINASNRAKEMIKKLGLAKDNENMGICEMLRAAASTYVAGVITSSLEILRLVLIFGNNRED